MADKPTRQQRERERARLRQLRQTQAQQYNIGVLGGGSTSMNTGGTGGTATTTTGQPVTSPTGGAMFDPNAYLPAVPKPNPSLPIWAQPAQAAAQADPKLAQPLITGRENDPQYVNELNLSRLSQAQGFSKDPQAYAQQHDQYLNQEQSLIDKGMSMLGSIFNYQDDADLEIFGVNLSAVESVADGFMRHFVGGYDLLSIGLGGLISAMPGGLRTLSYDELSAGRSVGEVLNGDIGMLGNAAPSPMQIAIASVATEAKRIREGGARLSDVLLANPATAPFILAGIAAESSPLQADGFDIMDPKQREKAFGSGWEQWMSGIGDAGLQFADPLIAVGWGAKAARLGMMGTRMGKAAAPLAKLHFDEGFKVLTGKDAESITLSRDLAVAEQRARWTRKRGENAPVVPEKPASPADAGSHFWEQLDPANAIDNELRYRNILDDAKDPLAQLTEDDLGFLDAVDNAFQQYQPPVIAQPQRTQLERLSDEIGTDPRSTPQFWDDMHEASILDKEEVDLYTRLRDEEATVGLDGMAPNDARYVEQVDGLFDQWRYNKFVDSAESESIYPGTGGIDPRPALELADSYDHPAAQLMASLLRKDPETGKKAIGVRQIMKMREIRRLPNKGQVARLLHSIDDPYEMTLTFQAMHGVPEATAALQRMAPALADEVFGYWQEIVQHARYTDPTKIEAAKGMLQRAGDNLQQQLDYGRANAEEIGDFVSWESSTKAATLRKSKEQVDTLMEMLDGQRYDPLVPTGAFYDPDQALATIRDLYRRQDIVEQALQSDVRDAMRTVDIDHRVPLKNNWYTRMVANSRLRRAEAAFQYDVEGSGLVPKRVPQKITIGDKVDDATSAITVEYSKRREGWFAPSQFEGVGRFRRAARVWRWFGSETPSGYIGLKGTAAVGAENEFLAALDLDLYNGKGILVRHRNAAGEWVEEFVGGDEKRAQYVDMFTNALADPTLDPMSVLTWIEHDMVKDFSLAYGFDEANFSSAMATADHMREKNLELIRKRGFFIDPDSGERHYVPYLKTHLANGTYMHNWHAIEQGMKRHAADNAVGAGTVARDTRKAGRAGVDLARKSDEFFQSLWRPATLLRLSYTQRNVFEGMLRSMAYWGSVAPLTWPVRATGHGIANVGRARKVARVAGKVEKRLGSGPPAERISELTAAQAEYYGLGMALKRFDPEAGVAKMHVFSYDPEQGALERILTVDEWLQEHAKAMTRLDAAEVAIEAHAADLDRAGKGTAFGKWRKTNLDDLEVERKKIEARKNIVEDMLRDVTDPDTADLVMREASELLAMEERNLLAVNTMYSRLKYNPMEAMKMYRSKAGRARRIGSGTSVARDGTYYNNAFADAYENMNRGMLSADLTVKQSLSASSTVFGNIFMHVLSRQNEPIPWGPLLKTRQEWVAGMREVIERNSNNQLIHVMLQNDGNMDKVVEWLLFTPQGEKYTQHMMSLMGSDFGGTLEPLKKGSWLEKLVYGELVDKETREKISTRLRPYAEMQRDPMTGKKWILAHPEEVSAYLEEVWVKLDKQMQGHPEFLALQRNRAADMARGGTDVVSEDDVWGILNRMTPEEQAKLGSVQGELMIEQGTAGWMEIWRKTMGALFHAIGTIPEDAVVRGPFYAKRFKQVRNQLIEAHFEDTLYRLKQQGIDTHGIETIDDLRKARKRLAKDSAGVPMPDSIAHQQFTIPADHLSQIYEHAHRQALRDTRDWMYTIERRTKLGKYGEYLFPFISATQNSTTVAGKLLWRNPWIAPVAWDLWRMPNRLGWEDDQGNIQMPMPFEFVKDFLKDNPNIPMLGGILGKDDMITIPKDGLNVFMPDTGFGLLPRPAVWAQMAASELMKAGAFPVEAPAVFKAMAGNDQNAQQMWDTLKDYMFGTQDTMSSKFLSYDKALPAWIKRIIESKDELSSQYGYQYQLIWATELTRYRAGERDTKPTFEEINERTTNMFWFMALGNLGVPTPLTPYPILTRPEIQKTRIEFLQERFKAYQKADPINAAANFYRDYGDFVAEIGKSQVSKNVGGADSTPTAVSDIKTLDPLIRELAPLLGDGNHDVLDIVVNNRDPLTDFDEAAYQWERATKIGGTDRSWRENQSPEEAALDRQRSAGWTEYSMFMDTLDARLHAAGFSNYEAAGAIQFKMARNQFLWNAEHNPDRAGWYQDYVDAGGNRIAKSVMTLEKAVANPGFRDLMIQSGKTNLLGSMDEYVYYRRTVINAVKESGKSINDPVNMDIKQAWLNIRQRLGASDVRFSEIMNRWLANDEEPQYVGDYLSGTEMAMGASSVN